MPDPALNGVLRRLRRLTGTAEVEDGSDLDLLERFVRGRDEDAFARLVRRHGPAVLGVCRRVVGNAHDAEDAFQATFLVLARKAGSIRRRTSLSCWLHGVAYRVAANLRRGILRRRRREAVLRSPPSASGDQPVTWNEVQAALDEELARLPLRYRAPLVLCYLDGKTRDEAARQLGWGAGTLRGRLDRGRTLLRSRLIRRGLTLPAALAALVLAPDPTAAVSPELLSVTVRAACAIAAGEATGLVSAKIIALASGVSRTMFPTTLRIAVALLVVAGLFGSGVGVLSQRRAEGDRAVAAVPAADADRPKEEDLRQEVDRLRRENERLRKDVEKFTYRLTTLEAKLALEKAPKSEVHFKGKTLSYWLEQLRDRDANTRMEAVAALAAIGEVDAQVIPVLAGALKDRDYGVRAAVVKALLHIGAEDPKAVPVLVRAAGEGPSEIRYEAIRALGSLTDPKTVPALIEALGAKEEIVRGEAAAALGRFGPKARAAVAELVRLLRQDGPYVRVQATLALLAIGPAAAPAVADVLKSPDADRRLCAVIALAGGGTKAVPLLVEALKDPDATIRATAAEYLGNLGCPDDGPTAKIAVNNRGGPAPFSGQVATVPHADVREAIPALRDALRDRDTRVRTAAATALGQIGPEARPAARALVRLWQDRDGATDVPFLFAVVHALWRIDPVAAARAGVRLQAGDRGPRVGPGFGGGRPGPGASSLPEEARRAIPTLIRALADEDPETRAAAAGALGELGTNAAAAVPALARALQDDNEAVRTAATKALDRIRDP